MNINDVIKFLKRCVSNQLPNTKKPTTIIHVNTIKCPITGLHMHTAKYSFSVDEGWQAYLSIKYEYFSCIESGGSNIEELNSTITSYFQQSHEFTDEKINDKALSELNLALVKLYEDERIVFLQRISDLEEPDVIKVYYNDLPQFLMWIDKVKKNTLLDIKQASEEILIEQYNQIITEINNGADLYGSNDLRLCTEVVLSLYSDKLNYVSDKVKNFKKINLGTLNRLKQKQSRVVLSDISRKRISDITHKLVEIVSETKDQSRFTKSFAIEEEFIQLLATEYSCEYVDYLEVENQTLQVRITTDHSVSSDSLGDSQRYSYNEGVSGSLFLIKKSSLKQFVGTNDIKKDQRISKRHEKDWEEASGKDLRNYWLLPIFEGTKLKASIRVVNKIPESNIWSYYELYELAVLSQSIAPVINQLKKLYISNFSDFGLSGNDVLSIIDEEWGFKKNNNFFIELVSLLMSIGFRRVEKKSLGVTLAIFKRGNVRSIQSQKRNYNLFNMQETTVDNIKDLKDCFSYIDPNRAMFAFDSNGKFLGCYEIENSSNVLINPQSCIIQCSSNFKDNALILQTARNSNIIRGVRKGKILGDIYLKDDSGQWSYRSYQDQLNSIMKVIEDEDIEYEYIEEIFEKVWNLAYKKIGSIITVTNQTFNIKLNVEYWEIKPTNMSILKCSESELDDIASLDGSLILYSDGLVQYSGVIVKGGTSEPDNQGQRGGARHAAGKYISKYLSKSLVFVVSENGGITFFFNGISEFYKA